MFRPLGVHGLVDRTLAVQRRNPPRIDRALHSLSRTHALTAHSNVLQSSFRRAASTSTTPSAGDPTSPPSVQAARKAKVELRPGPVKPAPHTASSPTAPPPAPTDSTVAAAEAVKAHAYSSGKAVEQMSTFETMKFDVRDAVARGIMTAPAADASRPGQLWHQMREVFKFYWRGIKQINANRKEVRDIRLRVKEGGSPLTRAESRFIRVYTTDTLKLIPFVLIAVVLEEVIPLLVLYAPWMLPSTCILPSQRERIQRKQREKQIVFLSLHEYFQAVRRRGADAGFVPLTDVQGTSLQAMCGLLGLSTWGPPPLRRYRLANTFKYLAADDAQLREEGFGERLSDEELVQALHERAITTETLPQSEWLKRLRWWLKSADSEKVQGDPISRRALLVATLGALR